jgi:L-proline amide hydrolase
MVSREDYVRFAGHRTWYRISGDPTSLMRPLVIVHDGPGCTHD